MAFQAKITLSKNKQGPLSHTGFKGRVVAKGASFRTVNQEEAAYYRAQPGFSILIEKGKLPTPKPDAVEEFDENPDSDAVDDDDVEDDSEEESDDEGESEDDKPKREVSGAYERADLKKMSKGDLIALIKSDRDLPLRVKDVPSKASKREIIDLILDAQAPEEGGDEDDDDED